MEEVQKSGKAKSIGVSNFIQKHLETILETATITPALNQIEYHPYLQRGNLVEWSKSKGIVTAAYAPLTPVTKAKPGPLDDTLAQLAKKYAVNEGEILLRWAIEKGAVAITTSKKETRLSDCLRTLAIRLTPAEIKEIDEIGDKKHFRGFAVKHFGPDDRS
jgi:diketogulonate reductase-like aldo/keto reductase